MLRLVVVDSTAESRNRLAGKVTRYLDTDLRDVDLLPRISLKPLALQELKFHAAPDICIIGPELVSKDLGAVASVRKLLPETPIVVALAAGSENLATIEHLALLGVDDTITDTTSAHEFFKKIILLAKRQKKAKAGKLILVDSGKGGIGVTSVAAGLCEMLLDGVRKIALVDLDFETQDLSRFLQARPFLNENLQLLFDGTRPVTEDFVEQCLVPLWEKEDRAWCVPPCKESEDLYNREAAYSRTLLSVLEILDDSFDCVIVDAGSARGAMLKALYRVADHVVVLVNNDPATLFAVAERVRSLRGQMAPNAQVTVVENGSGHAGLSSEVLKREFCQAAGLSDSEWFDRSLPFFAHGSRWPASGDTLVSTGSESLMRAFEALTGALGFHAERATESPFLIQARGKFGALFARICTRLGQMLRPNSGEHLQQAVALPESATKHFRRPSQTPRLIALEGSAHLASSTIRPSAVDMLMPDGVEGSAHADGSTRATVSLPARALSTQNIDLENEKELRAEDLFRKANLT
jgi:MinD-like ATPase involved in chromosome partitioning or flagellar assembly